MNKDIKFKLKPIKWQDYEEYSFDSTVFLLLQHYIFLVNVEGECRFNNKVFSTREEAKKYAQIMLEEKILEIVNEYVMGRDNESHNI